MGVIIPMDRIREKQGVPSDFPPQFEADKLNTNYYAIVAIVMRGGPEELADFLEHELGSAVPTDFLEWLNMEAWV